MMQLGTLPGLPIRPGILATPQIYVSPISVIPDIRYRESRFSFCHFDHFFVISTPGRNLWFGNVGDFSKGSK